MTTRDETRALQARLDAVSSGEQGFLIADFFNGFLWFDQNLDRLLTARGWPSISRTESQIMVLLSTGLSQQNEIAQVLGISPQAINQSTNHLAKLGLIHLEPDPADRRKRIISFPPEGEAFRREAVAILLYLEDIYRSHLGPRRAEQALAVLGHGLPEAPDPSPQLLDKKVEALQNLERAGAFSTTG